MSSINDNIDNELEEIEVYSLDDMMEESLLEEGLPENDMEGLLYKKDRLPGKKNKRFQFKNYKKLILVLLVLLIIGCYAIYKIFYFDANDKLRKYVTIETIDDINDTYEHWNNTTGNKNAYLIMLTSEGEGVDNYYMYTSTIVYRLLHKAETRVTRSDVDVVVMVTEEVADWKLKGLHNLGAVIKRVEHIRMGSNVLINRRWRNCYTKLHMFKMTEYDTIIYLDSDLYIKKNIDELFDLAYDVRNKTGRQDFFGAVTDGNIKYRYHNRETKGMLNAGLMILTPETAVYKDLIELAPQKDLYNANFMEQGLLSYYYSDTDNLFNRTRYHIDARYNAQWLSDENMEFYDKVYVIHQKLGRVEGAKSQQVQKDIFDSIVEWMNFVNKEKVDLSYN